MPKSNTLTIDEMFKRALIAGTAHNILSALEGLSDLVRFDEFEKFTGISKQEGIAFVDTLTKMGLNAADPIEAQINVEKSASV